MTHYSNSKSLDSSTTIAKSLEEEKRMLREYYNPMIVRQKRKVRILPRNYQELIRRYNDEGVI